MIRGQGALRLLVTATALCASLSGCSERNPAAPLASRTVQRKGPTLSQAEVLKIAQNAALKEGMKVSDYGPPQSTYEVSSGEGRWTVFYPGIVDKPESFFNVFIDDATGTADVLVND